MILAENAGGDICRMRINETPFNKNPYRICRMVIAKKFLAFILFLLHAANAAYNKMKSYLFNANFA